MPKPVRERLTVGQPCEARGQGLYSKPERGVIAEVLPRGYLVKLDGYIEGTPPKRFPEKKVTATYARKPIPKLLDQQALKERAPGGVTIHCDSKKPVTASLLGVDGKAREVVPVTKELLAELRPQPKPQPAWRSPAYRAFVRGFGCCHCGSPPPSDPDHNGKRGVGQKAPDSTCAPLCRWCHQVRTDFNRLPDLKLVVRGGSVKESMLLSAEETAKIIAEAQRVLLAKAMELLYGSADVDVFRACVEAVPEALLAEVLQ